MRELETETAHNCTPWQKINPNRKRVRRSPLCGGCLRCLLAHTIKPAGTSCTHRQLDPPLTTKHWQRRANRIFGRTGSGRRHVRQAPPPDHLASSRAIRPLSSTPSAAGIRSAWPSPQGGISNRTSRPERSSSRHCRTAPSCFSPPAAPQSLSTSALCLLAMLPLLLLMLLQQLRPPPPHKRRRGEAQKTRGDRAATLEPAGSGRDRPATI